MRLSATRNLLAYILVAIPACAQVAFTLGANGFASLSYNGTSFLGPFQFPIDLYYMCDGEGGETQYFQPAATKTSGADWIQHVYRDGQADSATVRMTYSTEDANTIKIVIQWTNNDATHSLCNIAGTPLRLTVGDETITTYTPQVAWSIGVPAIFVKGTWGSLATWHDYSASGLKSSVATWTTGAKIIYLNTRSSYGVADFSGLITTYEEQIAPGQSKTYSIWLRFGTPSDTLSSLAPESVALFETDNTMLVDHPDRRRLCSWFMADYGTRRTENNPRGYYSNAVTPVSDYSAFRTTMLAWADTVLGVMDGMTPKPQGIILWDLEGQEFAHALTYVGDPRHLAEYSPEMELLADELITKIKNSGYSVGLTIRPTELQFGTSPPATCYFSETDPMYNEYFLNTSAYTFPSTTRTYRCTATDTWTASVNNNGNGYQPANRSLASTQAILEEKVAYAIARWGVTMFYADTVVYEGGSPLNPTMWRTLQAEFPQVLFFPEQEITATYSAAAPYGQMSGESIFSGAPERTVYPKSFRYIQSNDGDLAGHANAIKLGIRNGDIYAQRCWFNEAQHATLSALYVAAAVDASVVTVTDTDSGKVRSFSAAPHTTFTYPLNLRVYFATSEGGLAASTTYCENKGAETCSLNLSGMTHFQLRLYDFSGRSVSRGTPGTL